MFDITAKVTGRREAEVKMNEVNELIDLLCFGKYKGKSVEHVIKEDAQYLLWAEEQGIISLSDDLQEAVSECAYIQHCDFLRDHGDNEQFEV